VIREEDDRLQCLSCVRIIAQTIVCAVGGRGHGPMHCDASLEGAAKAGWTEYKEFIAHSSQSIHILSHAFWRQ
jgi:hypothetical protein